MKIPSPYLKYKVGDSIYFFTDTKRITIGKIQYINIDILAGGTNVIYKLDGWMGDFTENNLFKTFQAAIKAKR